MHGLGGPAVRRTVWAAVWVGLIWSMAFLGGATAAAQTRRGAVPGRPSGSLAGVQACAVSGRVTLAGRSVHSGTAIRVDGRDVAATDATGAFRIDDWPGGRHLVVATHAGFLSADGVFDCQAPPGPVALPAGDVDADDSVGIFDLVVVAGAYGSCSGTVADDARADLNETRCVDLLDLVLLGASYHLEGPIAWPAPSGVSFAADVLPSFQTSCRMCHGDSGGLDLGTYAHVMAGSHHGPVVVPGNAGASPLYLQITGREAPGMPPGGVRLAPDAIELIRRWIEAGAPNN